MIGEASNLLCDLYFLSEPCANPLFRAEGAKGAEIAERLC